MPIDWPRFRELVRTNDRFLLTSHVRPDCDALGSELGMAGVLEALGKQVLIVNAQATPPNLAFIDPRRKIMALGEDIQPDELKSIDALMVLDTSAWVQLGAMADVIRASSAVKMVMDHHVSQDDLGAQLFKNTTAEATGRIVVEAAEQLGVTLTAEIARPLFAAIATDTGWFRFQSTTGDTYRFTGRLVDAGAVPQEIYTELYEQDTLERLNLIGRVMARAVTELDGRLVHTAVFLDDFAETRAVPTDTEDVVNMTFSIAGTEAAVIFVEQPDGKFKISFRSRAGVDCSRLAEMFAGGGHKAAAGAMVAGPFQEVQGKVLDAVRAAMK